MRTVSRSLRARTLRSLTRGPLGLSRRAASSFMTSYEAHKAERAAQARSARHTLSSDAFRGHSSGHLHTCACTTCCMHASPAAAPLHTNPACSSHRGTCPPSFPSMPFARRQPTPLTPPWPHSQGIVPLPLDATQTASLIEEMKTSQDPKLLALLEHRVPPGVDEAPAARRPPFAAARRRPYPPGAQSGQAERQRG